ncbi:hypothetical protein Hanom_Chr01g00046061 [Helianthus anomalus]
MKPRQEMDTQMKCLKFDKERDVKCCAGHGGSSRNKDQRPSHLRDCTGLSKDVNCYT